MLKLLRNEYAKIFRKVSTYVILSICLLMSVGINLLIQLEYDYEDDYYYEDWTLYDELQSCQGSDELYDKVYAYQCKFLIDMGYEYWSDVPSWISSGTNEVINSHLIYIYASELGAEEAMEMYDISLENVDIEYEKNMAEAKLAYIKASDYKGYSQKCMEHIEHQKKLGIKYDVYGETYNYEYHKYIVEKDINPEEDESKLQLLYMYADAKQQYDSLLEKQKQGEKVSDFSLEQKREVYEVYKYLLNNDIDIYLTDTFEDSWYVPTDKFINALTSNVMVASMAGIFVMIIAAGIIANEFSNGTIKFLLINPVKRAKIFWSKYITCITLLAASMATFFVIHLLFCIIICGVDGLNGVYVTYNEGIVSEQSILIYSLIQYLLYGISLATSVTLAFTISSLMRNNAVAVAISVAVELLGTTVTMFLAELGHDWARYFMFANTDIASISNGNNLFPGQTVEFSIIVLAVYFVIFLFTAYDSFKKKDV